MKFYNRENELTLLDKIEKQSEQSAQMTFVVGRRRIGKTSVNDLDKKVTFADVKCKKENISISTLKEKSQNLQTQYKGYDTQFLGLSMDDM